MYINKKIAKGISIILKTRKVFGNETLFSLYCTFVYPYLNYCIHVWSKAYDTHLRHLTVLQNKVIRIINGVPPRTNVDNLYFKHNILYVKRLYSYNAGLFMYKYSNWYQGENVAHLHFNLNEMFWPVSRLFALRHSMHWPVSQIPRYTSVVCNNAPFRTEMCPFLFWMLHCGIWDRHCGICEIVLVNPCFWSAVYSESFTADQDPFSINGRAWFQPMREVVTHATVFFNIG